MALPLRHLPVLQNWDCHVCGTCCKEYLVTLTDEERQVRKLAASRHAPGDWIRRARMIAHSWDGARTAQIAAELGCHPQTVRERLQELLPKVMLLDNFGASETGFQGTGKPGSSPEAGLKFEVNDRTTVTLCITRAECGKSSHTSQPGSVDRIGFSSPRMSSGASGFRSASSSWLGEP